jgi:hypothetical protein
MTYGAIALVLEVEEAVESFAQAWGEQYPTIIDPSSRSGGFRRRPASVPSDDSWCVEANKCAATLVCSQADFARL